MAKKRKIRIGVCSQLPDEIVERPLGGLLRFAAERQDVLLCDCRTSIADDVFHTDELPPWKGRVDGVVLNIGLGPNVTPDDVAHWAARGGVPVVTTAGDFFHPSIPVICTEVNSIARLAADHLIACGCRSFLHVGYVHSMGSRRRAEALAKVLAKRGRISESFDFDAVRPGETEAHANSRNVERLAAVLKSLPKPVGVLALGDTYARLVWKACDQQKLAVPRQVAIVGMNDMPTAFAQKPTLTSIGYPGEEVGHQAAVLLLQLIRGGQRPRKPLEIPATKLFARESTTGRPEDRDELGRAVTIISRQACAGLTVTELARLLCVSRRWLEMAFREHLGRSPLQEIQRVRLFHAEQLLQLTDMSITQVGLTVGFATPAAMTNFFRRLTGASPSEYRQRAHRVRHRTISQARQA